MKNKILLVGVCCIIGFFLTGTYGVDEDKKLIEDERKVLLKEKSEYFDKIITQALEEKYSKIEFPEPIKQSIYKRFERWSCVKFFDAYTNEKNTEYPEDRLEQLCAKIKDIQLEFFYITEVDMGLYNNLYQKGYDPKSPCNSPFLLLERLSYDQSLIVKSRILWEKIMNFIYYLESGAELEMKKKSKKGVFFDFIEKTPKWNFFSKCKDIISKHDDKYRTPEVHKGSTLKKELVSPQINPDELLTPLNFALNIIWENVISIISGETPKLSWGV